MFRLYRSITSRTAGLHSAALLVLRAVTGWLLILHGLYKVDSGLTGFELGVLMPLGLPATGLLSWLIPTFEIAAGALLIAGLLTRVVVLLVCGEMLMTGFWIKLGVWQTGVLGPNGAGGAEVDFLFFAVCLLIFAAGPGALATDSLLRLERTPRDQAPAPAQAPAQAQGRDRDRDRKLAGTSAG
ncbi:DoxX family protein [Streptomyces adelaidensis]|uniref:DoxX family protein n=1 Tax=Streptomyces adelaidensis TaxID=2796465 RepID=UPI00190380EF|nr:DoxX family protein [Streptomyces adelaidensis]